LTEAAATGELMLRNVQVNPRYTRPFWEGTTCCGSGLGGGAGLGFLAFPDDRPPVVGRSAALARVLPSQRP